MTYLRSHQAPPEAMSLPLNVHLHLRGCGEGWANHFSVQTRKESALIIEFVSESHVAELIQGVVFDVDHDFEGPRGPKAHLDTGLAKPVTPPGYPL